jgi:hypothetical protein
MCQGVCQEQNLILVSPKIGGIVANVAACVNCCYGYLMSTLQKQYMCYYYKYAHIIY